MPTPQLAVGGPAISLRRHEPAVPGGHRPRSRKRRGSPVPVQGPGAATTRGAARPEPRLRPGEASDVVRGRAAHRPCHGGGPGPCLIHTTSCRGASTPPRTSSIGTLARDEASAWPSSARDAPSLTDRKSTRLNSSHGYISYAVFVLK